MNTPKISIIIPVYNKAKYLDDCVRSVLDQTMSDIEVILVDDGSTDNISPQMCDDYAARDSRVKVIHKENGGLMSAWICGTKEAQAPYVSYVDSDDWVDTDMYEALYKKTTLFSYEQDDSDITNALEDFFVKSEIISSNYIVEKTNERRKETQTLAPGEYTEKGIDIVRFRLLGEEIRPVTMSRCMKLISRQLVLDNIQYCNPKIRMSEDVNIMLPCLCDCHRLVIMEGSYFYHYRSVGESIVHSYDTGLMANLELTDKTYREIFKVKGIPNGEAQMDKEYVQMLFLSLKNELRCDKKDTVKRVRNIFMQRDIRKKVLGTRISVSSKANKLLYFCMKHPNAATVNISKAIINAYDKKTNS